MEAEPYPLLLTSLHPLWQIGFGVVSILILLGLSGVISAAEVAYFSLTPADILALQTNNSRPAHRVVRLLESPRYLLSTLLIANTFINIAVVLVMGILLYDWILQNPIWLWVQGILAAGFIIVFGEIAPKIYGSQRPLDIAIRLGWTVRMLRTFFMPANVLLVNSSRFIENRLRLRWHQLQHDEVSERDIEQAIEISIQQTPYAKQDVAMLKSLVHFSNTSVRTAMRPRIELVAIPTHAPFSEVIQTFRESAYSRIPVYKDDINHIVGVLHTKDILAHLDKTDAWEWVTLCREPLFVPENKKLDDLLASFQALRAHLAIVIDEFGKTSGIVTMEDVLEEVVGDIEDEFDEPAPASFTQINQTTFIFDATTPLDEVCDALHLHNERFKTWQQDADTLAGLLLILHGMMPESGTKIELDELEFLVLEANERKIERVQLTLIDQNPIETQHHEVS